MDLHKTTTFAGLLIVIGMIAGIFSVAPAADSTNYLTEVVEHDKQVLWATIFQFTMSLCYAGVSILLYPLLARYHKGLAIGFLNFRVIAVCLSLIGTVLLLSVLSLSEAFLQNAPPDLATIESLGYVLKSSRDYVNHVFMVFMLCIGNTMLYVLLIKKKLIPLWLSVWGIGGALLSIFASLLVLFKSVEVITSEYLILNAPTAVFELAFSIWLIKKGIGPRVSHNNSKMV